MRVSARSALAQLDVDQREVGGAAADVDHQHEPHVRERRSAERVAVAVEPVVERGLRLLEQAHARQARALRGLAA